MNDGSTQVAGGIMARLRNKRGWSQQRLGELAGVNQSFLSRVELGSRVPSRQVAENLVNLVVRDPLGRKALLAAFGYTDPAEGAISALRHFGEREDQ